MDKLAIKKCICHIKEIRLPVIESILHRININGRILEIGAGTCWLAAHLSKQKNIEKISAVDNDEEKLSLAKSFFINEFAGKPEKIKLVHSDFHRLPFENGSFNYIVCDAALHHSGDLSLLLKELCRVLKKDGKIIAIREPILPLLTGLKYIKKLSFGYKEKKKGDIEQTYTIEEWKTYFERAGFRIEIKKYTIKTTTKERIIDLFKCLNGILFNRTYLIASKR